MKLKHNKKGALDFKTYLYGFLLFSAFAITMFGAFTDSVTFYGKHGISSAADVSSSEVITATNRSNVMVSQTFDELKSNKNSDVSGVQAIIQSAWRVISLIINSVSYPSDILTAVNNDVNAMAEGDYPGLNLPQQFVLLLVGFIVIGLIVIFISAIIGKLAVT